MGHHRADIKTSYTSHIGRNLSILVRRQLLDLPVVLFLALSWSDAKQIILCAVGSRSDDAVRLRCMLWRNLGAKLGEKLPHRAKYVSQSLHPS